MKSRIWILAVMTVFTAMVAVPVHVHGVQTPAPADQHADHHPGQPDAPAKAAVPASQGDMMASMMTSKSMMASNAKLDVLVTKMNTAKGSAKTDAIAELLTAIVQEHHTMQGSMMSNMSTMSSMMQMMGSQGGHGGAGSVPEKK